MKEIILNESCFTNREEFHHYIRKELDFPDYYGCNFDALHDCLTDLSEAVFFRVIRSREARKFWFDLMLKVIRDCTSRNIILKTES